MNEVALTRPPRLCHDAVIIDGIGGCGKTMLSAIVASLQRVEILNYSYEIEQYCILHHLGLMNLNAASQMVRYQLDLLIYNVMMGRNANFRWSDLSSVFNSRRKSDYLKRIFAKGDEVIPERIERLKPILHLATHGTSSFIGPLMAGAPDGLLFINMHRHPLFMVKQNAWNMDHLLNSPRHFSTYYQGQAGGVPFYYAGREELMQAASSKEKAIYYIEWMRKRSLESSADADPRRTYELTFESLVHDPYPHIDFICQWLRTSPSSDTPGVLKKEKIPRTLLTDGRARSIYRRVGWQKTQSRTPGAELEALRAWAYEGISADARQSLDWLCHDYALLVDRLEGAKC